jgi:phosphomannomutase
MVLWWRACDVSCRCLAAQVPGSLLCLLFDPDNDQLLVKDTNGRVFLDHDPAVFSLVLRYLRELKVTGGEEQQSRGSSAPLGCKGVSAVRV